MYTITVYVLLITDSFLFTYFVYVGYIILFILLYLKIWNAAVLYNNVHWGINEVIYN